MSGAAKRPYEDESGGDHSSSYKYPREESDSYSKLSSAAANEYHPPSDLSQDTRIAKIPRTEVRDPHRRSPLHSTFRIQQSSNDLHLSAAPDNRSESRDTKDNKDQKIEIRDVKTDPRELYADCWRDSHNIKIDKEVRYVNRVNETKDSKYDRDGYNDFRGDIKSEKDVYGASTGHLDWKESKEYHRGKRYPEAPVGSSMDSWLMSRATVQITAEIGKDGHATEERDYVDAREAVGGNKIDSKGEDKLKEKERKRKDVKQREWGERDKDKSDHKSSFQVANSSSGPNESAKEDRDGERWERDRKDPFKEREKLRGKDNDNAKRESWTGVDKEVSICEKELGDGSIRIQNQESSASEQKKHEEVDHWKTADKETRDRKKDRDVDGDADQLDRRGGSFDKGSEEGCADVESVIEREREAYDYGVQHRKRMHRSRGSPQLANREPRFRSRTQDHNGLPGKAVSSQVIYKVGKCMQELIKLWKEYDSSATEKNGEGFQSGPTLEIRIPAEHAIATNRQVRGGQLWGTDVYTVDSDLVAVLMHTGYCRLTASPPPTAIQELRATIQVLPPQDCYVSTLRNNVRSRAWGAAIGCSYRMESCCIVKKGGGTIDLEPCLTHTVEPTLAPVAVERTMTTRAAASSAVRQQRFIREITIQYNLCNEPWIKYSISIVADKGLKKPQYTSARLKKGEVLYLETHSCRYELSFTGEKIVKSTPTPLSQGSDADEVEKSQNLHPHISNGVRNDGDNIMIDMYRWSRCKKILPQMAMREVGIPLSLDYVEVLEEKVDWEDVQWSQTGVWVAGKEYVLARVHFLSMD